MTEADGSLTPTGAGVHTKFTEIAYSRLASRALSWSDGELTYRELDEAADRLAAGLVARGVGTKVQSRSNFRAAHSM